jgi:methylenetetrahydrofolate reductase (NADPH)
MTTISPTTTVADRADPIAAIADFVRGFSLEATRPSADDIADLADTAPKGTPVYVSAVSTHPVRESIEAAIELRKAGFEPVPHLAVRNFATADELDAFLARMSGEAGVQRALVIAGDRDEPAGDFHSSVEVIDGGALQRHGIVEVGIAGYPDGHPRIPQLDLDRALADKLRAAETTGVAVHIVTQFCFDGAAIVKWLLRLRDFGVEHPVRVGLAGPTNFSTLLRYAKRCGVRASAQGLARQAGLVRQLFAMSAPDALVRVLAQARAERHLGEIAPHFFSFGGLARTARWAEAVAQGRIALEGGEGFRVEPPRES